MNKKQLNQMLDNMNKNSLDKVIANVKCDNKAKAIKELNDIKDKIDILIYEIARY